MTALKQDGGRSNFIRIDDYATARAVMRNSGFAPVDLAGYFRALQEQSGRDLGILPRLADNLLFFMAGPRHLKLRNLVSGFLGTAHIAVWRPRIEQVIEHYLDRLAAIPDPDLIRDFVDPVFQTATGAILGLGCVDNDEFTAWTRQTRILLEPVRPLRELMKLRDALTQMIDYIDGIPPARPPNDPRPLLDQLLDELSDDFDRRDASILMAILFSTGQTASQTLGNILFHVLRLPLQERAMATDPAWMDNNLEALFRLHPSPQFIDRIAIHDQDVAGCSFKAGDYVHIHLPSANRDETAFPAGDGCPFSGPSPSAGHLSFGSGLHKCPGAAYARLAIGIALPRLLTRYPSLSLAADEAEWLKTTFIRAPISLPCKFRPESPA